MRPCVFFRLREPEFFFPQSDALHKKSHIPREGAHGLSSLFVHVGFTLFATVYRVPILARRYRHIGYSEIFIQLVKCRGTSAAPCAYHARADLHGLCQKACCKKACRGRLSASRLRRHNRRDSPQQDRPPRGISAQAH